MKSIAFALVMVLALPGAILGQWRNRKAMRPHNCQMADSLIGPPDGKAEVQTNYNASGDSTYLQSGGFGPERIRMAAIHIFRGRGPDPFPAPTLNFLVGRGRLATALVASPSPPNLTLLLDDTSALTLGRVPVGRFNGPAEVAIAPIAVHTLPAWSLALARAKTARLIVDSDTLKISQQDLREFNALYRFATCDSLPAR
jgi:hypothetical protein